MTRGIIGPKPAPGVSNRESDADAWFLFARLPAIQLCHDDNVSLLALINFTQSQFCRWLGQLAS